MKDHADFKKDYEESGLFGKMLTGRDEMLYTLCYIDQKKWKKYMRLIPEGHAMGDALAIAYRVQKENRRAKKENH